MTVCDRCIKRGSLMTDIYSERQMNVPFTINEMR